MTSIQNVLSNLLTKPRRVLYLPIRFIAETHRATEKNSADGDDFKSNAAPKDVRRLYVWGLAEHGALGYTSQVGKKKRRQLPRPRFQTPIRLHFGQYHKITDIACGYGFTLVSTKSKDTNQKLFGCGLNTDSQIGYHDVRKKKSPLEMILSFVRIQLPLKNPETQIKRIAAGRAHTVVVTDNECVLTFGNNSFGQCGRNIVQNEEYSKNWFCHMIKNVDGERVIDSVCGQDHTLFLSESGKIYSCGWGADGQTGLGHFNNQSIPSLVKGELEGVKIVKIASTVDCVLALSDKGDVFGWGNSEYGQISDHEMQISLPRFMKQCSNFSRIVDIAASGSACLILNEDGNVYSWGYGLLGRGPAATHSLNPTQIPNTLFGKQFSSSNRRVVSLIAGPHTFGAITNFGQLYMWGKNQFGQLGLGHVKDQLFPLKVAIGADVSKVSCGVDHTVALSKHFVT